MRILKILLIVLSVGCVCACSLLATLPGASLFKGDERMNEKTEAQVVNAIALLPVDSNVADGKSVEMLRNKLSEELRFKGYPPVDTSLIDARLTPLTEGKAVKKNNVIPPRVVEELVGADGAMYCSMTENKKVNLFYAPVTVTVSCALRSTKTGETVWNARTSATSRSFHVIRKTLDMKSAGDLEQAMEEAVGKLMETLPYGPKLRG